jgi:signal transduction histidine kinase
MVGSVATKRLPARRSGFGRLRPRARLLNSIGAELISSEIVAVIELVRNSYDADAGRVELLFSGLQGGGTPTLRIRDDGHGMTRSVLLGPWMEPATDHKSTGGQGALAGERSPLGRRRLGSKGVGRFASQRLGTCLRLQTRTAGSPGELRATFDWTQIEAPGRYLDELEIPWSEEVASTYLEHGTVLEITGLRDAWSADRFEKLRIALARLVAPDHSNGSFIIELGIQGKTERIKSLLDRTRAMYSLEGEVDRQGRVQMKYRDLGGAEEHWEREVLWPRETSGNCGPFRFRVSTWDLDREPLQHYLKVTRNPLGLRDFRRSLRDHSGISLYRDAFRILPYGEPDNDWLRLDRRRVNNPTMRLSNNQIVGVVELTADSNPNLKDQTNREGLVANPAYEHLREVVCELLGYLENRRFTARRSGQMGWRTPVSRLPGLSSGKDDALDELIASLASGGEARETTRKLKAALEAQRQAMAETLRLYAGLATTGQMAGMLMGQLGHSVTRFRSELDLLAAELDLGLDELDEEWLEDAQSSMTTLAVLVDEMDVRLQKLDPLARGGKGRRIRSTTLGYCTAPVIDAFAPLFAEGQIARESEGDFRLPVETNLQIAQQALAAVVDNAVYWVKQRKKNRVIGFTYAPSSITVTNNGPAIDPDDLPHVFDASFSRREDAAGLGLTLAHDLLGVIGGRLVVRSIGEKTSFSLLLGSG